MIKMITLHTSETEDPVVALDDLMGQLLKYELKRNVVGIISCHSHCAETGVAQYVSQLLPFDVAGCTTLANGTMESNGDMQICIAVLTSDTVDFSVAWAEDLSHEIEGNVKNAFESACTEKSTLPAMMLMFMPFVHNISDETIMEVIMKSLPGVPMFGMAASDNTPGFSDCRTIYNGKASYTGLTSILIWGDIRPQFFVTAIPKDNIRNTDAVITKSNQSILMEINNKPLPEFFQSIGITDKKVMNGVMALPFMVDCHDGAGAVARAVYGLTDEGYAACAGNMPENAALTLGVINEDSILQTASQLMEKIDALSEKNVLIAFSCVSRYFTMTGIKTTQELEVVEKGNTMGIPLLMAYSGGEICPIQLENGEYVNRFHNFSLAVCVL